MDDSVLEEKIKSLQQMIQIWAEIMSGPIAGLPSSQPVYC